jgi:hypothetical protein
MAIEPTDPVNAVIVEPEVLEASQFYNDNYTLVLSEGLGAGNKKIVLGAEPFMCRFCGGEPPATTFKNRAHAVSELLGNKVIESRYECDDCNKRFSTFEDDLAKMTLPARSIGGVIGKKNRAPTLISASQGSECKSRMEFKNGTLHVSHDAGDVAFVVDEQAKTLTYKYLEQTYRPLGAYKALCKSAFTLLPEEELKNFSELRQWLLQDDLTTDQVYARDSVVCYSTFVPAFKPFPQPFVWIIKRNKQIDAPYMSFFIASGNVSYQIFLPCPVKDGHLRGKQISIPYFPHLYQRKPWLIKEQTQIQKMDLGSPDRTEKRTGTMSWRYENKIKVA